MYRFFVPAYNEEENISSNVKGIYKTLAYFFKDMDFRLYVINDGSTDKTQELLDSIHLPKLIILHLPGPTRRENLVQQMCNLSDSNDIIMYMDSDRSTNEIVIPKMISMIEQGFDICIGNKYGKTSKIKRNFDRLVISKLYNWFVNLYYFTNISDHGCGFKTFRANVLQDLVKEMGWNNERKMFWDSEMLIRARRKGWKIAQVDVSWIEGPKSALTIFSEKSMIKYMLFTLKRKLK